MRGHQLNQRTPHHQNRQPQYLAPSTSLGPPPVLLLGRGAQLLQWLQQMQQTTQPASGPSSPSVSYGRARGSFQPGCYTHLFSHKVSLKRPMLKISKLSQNITLAALVY